MKIRNAVALVTGANRGIGLAFTRELLARGARTVYGAARVHKLSATRAKQATFERGRTRCALVLAQVGSTRARRERRRGAGGVAAALSSI